MNKQKENKINKNVSTMNTIEQVKERAKRWALTYGLPTEQEIEDYLREEHKPDIMDRFFMDERCFNIYDASVRNPGLSISKLCKFYRISEGKFRIDRLNNKSKWDEQIVKNTEYLVNDILQAANNPDFPTHVCSLCGKGWCWDSEYEGQDREQYKLPSSS